MRKMDKIYNDINDGKIGYTDAARILAAHKWTVTDIQSDDDGYNIQIADSETGFFIWISAWIAPGIGIQYDFAQFVFDNRDVDDCITLALIGKTDNPVDFFDIANQALVDGGYIQYTDGRGDAGGDTLRLK